MKYFESSKSEISPDDEIKKPEGLAESRENFAEALEREMRSIEVKRLRKPEGSAYDNLKRFGKRAIAMGTLISSLVVATPALSQTYRPYIEKGSIQTGAKIVSLESYKNKTPEIENRLKEARLAIDQALSRIGKLEGLSLAKLDVDVIINPDESNLSARWPLDAEFSHKRMLLNVRIGISFDAEKHAKALEVMLAHEIGHLINERANQDLSKQEAEAMRLARLENPEINEELIKLESKKGIIEQTKAPRLSGMRERVRELFKRLAVEDLTAAEGRLVRDELESLELQESEIIGDLVEADSEYRDAKNRTQELHRELEPKIIKHLISRGGPEVIADFFQARWAAKQGWSAEELKKAMKILIGEYGLTSSELYGPTVERRHALVQLFFERIVKEPEKYFSLPSDERTIRDYIEKIYEEFSSQNQKIADKIFKSSLTE